MSKHVLDSLKFSGGILSIYCLSLAIVPTAYAGDTNISNASGAQVANFNSYSASSGESGGSGEGAGAGGKSNPTSGGNRLATIRAAQGLQSKLDAAQTTYSSASNRLSQLLSAAPSSPPSTPTTTLGAVRFSVKGGGVKGEELTNCGCNNPDVAATPTKPNDNSAEIAAAREAQAQAARELAEAQAQARQFLASTEKTPQVSAQKPAFSPVW
jgi:hypothetical protein